MLLKYVMNLNVIFLCFLFLLILAFLIFVYQKDKKMNTIAVLIGAFGYLSIYISLIILSIRKNSFCPIIMYFLAILLFIMLCGIGIKANLKDPKVHWIIEISNIVCQALVAIATIILF